MNHTGNSHCPDDSRTDSPATVSGNDCRSDQYTCDSNPDLPQEGESAMASELSPGLPIQTARADAARARDNLPFVVQAGQVLFVVAEESSGWVVAELRFDPDACAFIEDRRARYLWPREAFGRLLSRVVTGDEIDHDEVYRISDGFSRWLASQFVTSLNAD